MSEYSEKELLYSAAVESSDDSILTKTLDGIITSWNPAAEKLYGYTEEEVLGKSVSIIVPKDLRSEVNSILKRIRKGGRVEHHETTRISKTGKRIHISLTVSPVKNSSGEIIGASAIARDITEKKMLEELFNQHIETFPVLIDADPKIIWMTDTQGNFTDFLQSKFNLSEQTCEERVKEFYETVHPEDLHLVKNFKDRVIKNHFSGEIEFRCWGSDGEWRWASMIAVPIIDEELGQSGWIGLKLDVTRSKRMLGLFILQLSKTTKQLRHLAMRINAKVEDERRRIAFDVHDQIGGNLSGIKHDLERIKAEKKDLFDTKTEKRLDEAIELIVTIIASVKRISSELHPAVLDYLGLVAAIKSEAETFCQRFGILCEFNFEVKDTSLEKEQELAVFRIFQEILRNVMRHANADKISIHLTENEKNFRLSVEDNGRGITESEKKSEKSLGLLSIEERIRHVGGTFEIKGIEGLGTTTTINIPLLTRKAESAND